jgi:hypothetical protein
MAYVPNALVRIPFSAAAADGGVALIGLWLYVMAAESEATLTGSLYFSDGDKKGMKVGDVVKVIGTTGPKTKDYQVTVVTAGSGATVAAPTAIT